MKIKNARKKINKAIITSSATLNTIALSLVTANAAPEGVDLTSYNAIIDIVFWIVGIAVGSAGVIPGLHKIAEGNANEDSRGRNAGISSLIIGIACFVAVIAVKDILF